MKKITAQYVSLTFGLILIGICACYWAFCTSVSTQESDTYLYVDTDDTADSVFVKIEKVVKPRHKVALKICAALMSYSDNVHSGRYLVSTETSAFRLIRNLRGGRQTPVRLVIPVAHTTEDLAGKLAKQLQADSTTLSKAFNNETLLKSLAVNKATLPCLFIPNTYEVYWDISPESLLKRMKEERDAFWTTERKNQAKKARLTPDEVITMASIVEQESSNKEEKPKIAGMYLNRLHQGMKLQADPTVKFALHDFALKRIMHDHLTIDSPYNTYRNEGLPIGPICIPSLESIEAVLHFETHNYLYMCAKEDFSGTHNFASTYEEHLKNAKRYAQALNEQGIK